MPQERPVDATKERMVLHIAGAAVGAQPLKRIALQKVPHQLPCGYAHRNACRKDNVPLKNVSKSSLSILPSERRSTIKHLVD